jgi:fatty-acyl-CoA synthase
MTTEEKPFVDGLTLGQTLARTVQSFGHRDALVFPQLGTRCSYRRFEDEVDEAARALIAIGVRPGEHVGLWATNRPQWVILQFATAKMGAVLVNINPAYRANELAYVLDQADITTLFLTDNFKGSSFFNILAEICPELADTAPGDLRAAACPRLRHVISIKPNKAAGMLNWDDFGRFASRSAVSELQKREATVTPGDVVNIQFTSGTTGFPKGAMLTHRNLLLNAFYSGQRLACTANDRICIPVPFYHCFGCVIGTLLSVVHGAAMVVPAESFDPLATLQAIQDERCSVIYGVPTMFIAQLTHPRFSEFKLSSLRTGIMAGSPCPIEVMREVVQRMGARDVTIAYGLTEASPVITQTAASDDLEHRVSTVGRPLPGLEVRIVESGTIIPASQGQPGELLVRGHCVMTGYYHKPAETAAAVTPDGWLHTGDLAVETSDGYFRITGRIKDLIIRGGENIYPREIEEFLYGHAAIAEAQVVGLPDARFGEEVSVWIRLKPGAALTADAVRQFCRERIAHYKVPRYVEFVSEYPTTVTGKIQKFKLREIGIERFDLQRAARIETA